MPNFADRFAHVADRFADRTAVEVQRGADLERVTYGALAAQANAWTAWLQTTGLGPGDRCAIIADNDAAWVAAYFGILQAGAVAVPLDTAYTSAQVHAILDNCEPLIVFTTARYAPVVSAALADTTATLVVRLYEWPRPLRRAGLQSGGHESPALERPTEDRRDEGSLGASAEIAPVAPEAPAAILYTSGTTSDPKGVVLTHANLDAERDAALRVIQVTEDDAVLGVLPLFHALAQLANLLLPLTVGARVVFLENVNSTTLLRALDERSITAFACVPQFFYLIHQRVMTEIRHASLLRRGVFRALLRTNGWLRDHTGWNPGTRWFARVHRALGRHMRWLITGGSRLDPAIGRDLYNLGFTLLNGYGLTETCGAATVMRPADRYSTSVGHALSGIDIRIAPRDTSEDATVRDGEILIRGPIVMAGYFRRPEATAESIRDGWLHTGDLGYLDRQGRLYITGRKKDLIVLASGKNIYPEEIEAHYLQSPFIKELAVLGVTRPDEPSAERLHAVVVPDDEALRERGIVNIREIIRFELEGWSVRLPPHKRVLGYDIWRQPLPRTTTGKIKRHEVARQLRAQAATAPVEHERPATDADRAWLDDEHHAALVSIVARQLHRPLVRPDANLELDLELDSMERVELLAALEQREGRRVTPAARATIFTVRHLVDAVEAGEPVATPGAGSAVPWEAVLTTPADQTIEAHLRASKFVRAAVCFCLLRIAAALARVILRLRVTGRANLPAAPFIISPNHQSYLDGFLVVAVLPFRAFRRLFFVGAAEYFDTPFMAWIARAINVVAIDPRCESRERDAGGRRRVTAASRARAVSRRRAFDRRRVEDVSQGRRDSVIASPRPHCAGRTQRVVRPVAAAAAVQLARAPSVARDIRAHHVRAPDPRRAAGLRGRHRRAQARGRRDDDHAAARSRIIRTPLCAH